MVGGDRTTAGLLVALGLVHTVRRDRCEAVLHVVGAVRAFGGVNPS